MCPLVLGTHQRSVAFSLKNTKVIFESQLYFVEEVCCKHQVETPWKPSPKSYNYQLTLRRQLWH